MGPKVDYYANSQRTEIDLRYEVDGMFEGRHPEIPKKQTAVLRKMRRDTSGYKTECACVDEVTQEPDKSTFCPYCWGAGWLWDESFIDIFKVVLLGDSGNARKDQSLEPITMSTPLYKFYVRYNQEVTEDDQIIELVLDAEGDVVRPYRRKSVYQIISAVEKRSDYGRIEFWEVFASKEEMKYLNGVSG